MRVGVLALQGGFDAHARVVAELGHTPVLVRNPADLRGAQALVLPGGESSVMLDLLGRDPLLERGIVDLVDGGAPVLATCAGLILIASRVHDPEQRCLGLLDVEVRRNARGRQVHSSETRDDAGRLPLVLIRAPRIAQVGAHVEVLATLEGEPVLVRQGRVVGATFHPELTTDRSVHERVFDHRSRVSITTAGRTSSVEGGPSSTDTSVSRVDMAIR